MKEKKRKFDHPPLGGLMNNAGMFSVDRMGSYTGRPADPTEQPVQDADDL